MQGDGRVCITNFQYTRSQVGADLKRRWVDRDFSCFVVVFYVLIAVSSYAPGPCTPARHRTALSLGWRLKLSHKTCADIQRRWVGNLEWPALQPFCLIFHFSPQPPLPQADIYSLGITIVELLQGEHPFAGLELPHVSCGD